jgi:UDP-N-acetylglucosamine--N-acetylmuramyl-(pentapeptide) pyrophosphoryl-undecaprenol N-acetylglucosamine transferase
MSQAVLAPATILIMAGGTGGHVMPGLAVAKHLMAQNWHVVWLGNPEGMEARLVPQHGIPMAWVQFGGLRGKGFFTKLMLPVNLLRAFAQAALAIKRIKPAVVLGLGGYISFPGGMMASLLGRPLVLHEQNSVAGLANKVLARLADRVLVAFPEVLPKALWCGNPVRQEMFDLIAPQQRYNRRMGALRVLVVGGSLGAKVLNDTVPQVLAALKQQGAPLPQVHHQTGRGNAQAVKQAYDSAGVQAQVDEFVQDMAQAYAWADLVICRAGALTVSELAAAGVASWLVPLPHAVDDHQTSNARFLANAKAGQLWPQPTFTVQAVAQALASTTRNDLSLMAQAAHGLAKPHATSMVAQTCAQVAKR